MNISRNLQPLINNISKLPQKLLEEIFFKFFNTHLNYQKNLKFTDILFMIMK